MSSSDPCKTIPSAVKWNLNSQLITRSNCKQMVSLEAVKLHTRDANCTKVMPTKRLQGSVLQACSHFHGLLQVAPRGIRIVRQCITAHAILWFSNCFDNRVRILTASGHIVAITCPVIALSHAAHA